MSCGCNDNQPLPLGNCNPCQDCPPPNALNLPSCIGGESCEDLLLTDCVEYIGPNLPALAILNKDRITDILVKLHKTINALLPSPIALRSYTATNTGASTSPALIVTYLGLGPVYTSVQGALGTSTTITVGSTTNLLPGMTLNVISGIGQFASGTTVSSITNSTQFVASSAPTIALSGGQTVITGTGSLNQIFSITVPYGTSQSFNAFTGSPVIVVGTGTIV